MSKHSHISAIFDNAFQSRAGSPDVYMSMVLSHPTTKKCKIVAMFSQCFEVVRGIKLPLLGLNIQEKYGGLHTSDNCEQ